MLKRTFLFTLLLTLFAGFSFAAKYKIERVEPTFWWANMVNPKLELMVYGPNISELKPEIDYPGVSVKSCVTLQSPNYLFVELHLDKNVKPGSFQIRFKAKGKTVLSHPYELKKRENGSANRIGFNNSDAIYLITPDRFVNGDESNDNTPDTKEKLNRELKGGRHGGDIQGLINSLDYIKDLGFTAIWVNPMLENDMKAYSYHGYATTDYYKVDSRYGTNEEYRKLGAIAKSKGIKVIMDMIANHCGSEHWWMKDLPSEDWVNNKGKYMQTSHIRTTNLDMYASQDDKRRHSDGWFVDVMPDLNQRQEQMANYLIQNTIWWIEFSHLTGIRQDTYPYPDKDFMTEWTRRILEEYPQFNIVGEEWSVNPVITSYWQKGKQNHDGYVSHLPSVMDFPIQNSVKEALNDSLDNWGIGFIKLYEMLSNDFLYPDPFNLVVFPDNHDMSRIYTQLNEDYKLWQNAMVYFATIRGIPQVYYGTEILMTNRGTEDHGVIRTDFPGGWKDDAVNAFTGKGLTAQQKEAQAFTKKILTYRRNSPVLHTGKLMHYAPEFSTYVLFRYNETKTVMTILNKNSEDYELPLARFYEMLKGKTKGKNILTGKTISLKKSITVPARTPMVIEITN